MDILVQFFTNLVIKKLDSGMTKVS